MSEYWVSHKKYFCKYCNIYIADDVPSRRQHETGLRHKGNVERFVRGLYKEGEKRKHDKEEEMREMARVEQVAQAAFARDVGAGLVKPGSSSGSAPRASTSSAAPKLARPGDAFANYTTAEQLGITDPDAERLQAEAERRRIEGVAGEWEMVAVAETAAVPAELGALEGARWDGEAGRKREAEQPLDEDDTRRFKLRKKTLAAGLGEIYDPGLIPIKVKKKEETPEVGLFSEAEGAKNTAGAEDKPVATEKPKWSARAWTKPGERSNAAIAGFNGEDEHIEDSKEKQEVTVEDGERQDKAEDTSGPSPSTTTIMEEPSQSTKQEVAVSQGATIKQEDVVVKPEAESAPESAPASVGALFRKRKVPAAGRGRR